MTRARAEDETRPDEEAMDEDEDEDKKDAKKATSGRPAKLDALRRRYLKRCGADFVLEQIASAASLDQAEMSALRRERDEARRDTKRRGINSRDLGATTTTATTTTADDFVEAAKAHQDKHGGTLLAAQGAVAKRHPKLYESYLDRLRVNGGARRMKAWGGHEPA